VDRALKRRLALAVAIAALVVGGAVAALAATAPSGHHARVAAGTSRDLPAASSYLNLPPAQLQAQVRSGRTLAQIAAATPGKSEAGLISAIVTARQAKLATLAAKLTKRVKAEVNRVPGQGATASVIRTYLGLPRTQLRSELLSGRTLAQIADATSGKSAAGLIATIVAARHKRLAAMLAAGKLTQAQLDSRSATLTRRVTRLVNTPRHRHAAG
jgi:hypothetical protein